MTKATSSGADTKLGTFGGVFTPSILTILGLVLFLRVGFVTGSVGLVQMLMILGLSTSVSLLTTISLAAIATNLRVGSGGVYYVISRTLGPAFGGAIGLVLYLAMSVSVAFYTIGLGEALASVVGSDSETLPRAIAAITIVVLLGIAWLGADIATRLQYVVMACLGVALLAYFIGVAPDLGTGQLGENLANPGVGDGFWVSFAIFFPAITGFTQGVAMSGDLRTPSRSITTGTFSAIGVSTAVYLLVILTFAMAVPLSALRADTAIMRDLSLHPALVDLGVIAATLSSAIASILGGPRTLQRLAGDRLIRPLRPFAVGSGADDNPRRAVVLSAAIALVTVALGDLDLIAPIISMFFLASYGMINYATYSEGRAASTSFRPTFRWFDWRLSLLGAAGCLAAIVAIDPLAGGLAGGAVYGLYRYLRQSPRQRRWADSSRGFHATEVRSHLQQMTVIQDAGRDWRPCTVAFVPRDHWRRSRLIDVASWIEGGSGFTTAVRIVPGRGPVARKHAQRLSVELDRELATRDQPVYGRVLVAADLESGVSAMVQSHGLGSLRPNLALFSWHELVPGENGGADDDDQGPDDDERAMLNTGLRYGCNVGVVHVDAEGWSRLEDRGDAPTIAVWWADSRTGQLLTLLAWMCTRAAPMWSDASLVIYVDEAADDDVTTIASTIEEARIPATVAGTTSVDRLRATVGRADLVFAPLSVRHGEAFGPGDRSVSALAEDLPVTVFVQAAGEVALDVQPDETMLVILAEARDRATAAGERAEELDKQASSLMVTAELLRLEACSDEQLAEAQARATQAHRRYLDARTRADEAWRLVRELDPAAAPGYLDPAIWVEAAARRPDAGTPAAGREVVGGTP